MGNHDSDDRLGPVCGLSIEQSQFAGDDPRRDQLPLIHADRIGMPDSGERIMSKPDWSQLRRDRQPGQRPSCLAILSSDSKWATLWNQLSYLIPLPFFQWSTPMEMKLMGQS